MTDAFSPDPLAAFSDRLATLAAEAAARVVAVHGRDGRARSGLLWAEGLVVTAEEALERDDELALTLPDGRAVPATLVGRDPGTDVALLKAETGAFVPLAPAAPAGLRPGHLVLVVGRGEHGPCVGFGPAALVGGPWRSMRGGRLDRRIQLGLRLDLMAEGGAVLDHDGRLVGMAVPGPRRRALTIPAETIARAVEQLRTRGRVARGYLGLATQPVQDGGVRGLIVVGLDPRSPAGQAGILLGDVLVGWDGAPLGSVREMLARLDPDSVGTMVKLDLISAGRPHHVRSGSASGRQPDMMALRIPLTKAVAGGFPNERPLVAGPRRRPVAVGCGPGPGGAALWARCRGPLVADPGVPTRRRRCAPRRTRVGRRCWCWRRGPRRSPRCGRRPRRAGAGRPAAQLEAALAGHGGAAWRCSPRRSRRWPGVNWCRPKAG